MYGLASVAFLIVLSLCQTGVFLSSLIQDAGAEAGVVAQQPGQLRLDRIIQ